MDPASLISFPSIRFDNFDLSRSPPSRILSQFHFDLPVLHAGEGVGYPPPSLGEDAPVQDHHPAAVAFAPDEPAGGLLQQQFGPGEDDVEEHVGALEDLPGDQHGVGGVREGYPVNDDLGL